MYGICFPSLVLQLCIITSFLARSLLSLSSLLPSILESQTYVYDHNDCHSSSHLVVAFIVPTPSQTHSHAKNAQFFVSQNSLYNKAPASSSHFSHSTSLSSFSALVLVSPISRFHSYASISDIHSLLPSPPRPPGIQRPNNIHASLFPLDEQASTSCHDPTCLLLLSPITKETLQGTQCNILVP